MMKLTKMTTLASFRNVARKVRESDSHRLVKSAKFKFPGDPSAQLTVLDDMWLMFGRWWLRGGSR